MGEELAFLAFLIGFPAIWIGVCKLIAKMGGWDSLAAKYPAMGARDGVQFRFRSGRLGMASYGNVLFLSAGQSCLHLSVLFLFRFGHDPISIPWGDITATRERKWAMSYVALSFVRSPEAKLRLPKSLGEALIRESRGVLSIDG